MLRQAQHDSLSDSRPGAKKAGLPRGKPAFLLQTQKRYWRAAGMAALAVMGEEMRLASLVLL